MPPVKRCPRAAVSPTARRRRDRQNEALYAWLRKYAPGGHEERKADVEDRVRATAKVTAAEPGGAWIERALRVVPQRLYPGQIAPTAHRRVLDVCAPLLLNVKRRAL